MTQKGWTSSEDNNEEQSKPPPEEESFTERLEKELYGEMPTERAGETKEIFGVAHTQAPETTPWQQEREAEERGHSMKRKKKSFLVPWLLFSLLILVASVAIFAAAWYRRQEQSFGVNLNMLGPLTVKSLELETFEINYSNNSDQKLVKAELHIKLPEKSIFAVDPASRTLRYSLGDLLPQASGSQQFTIMFVGSPNTVHQIETTLTYQPEKFPTRFETRKTLDVTVANEGVRVSLSLPPKIFTDQDFSFAVTLSNLTLQNLNLRLSIDPPKSFLLTKAFPAPSAALTWNIEQFAPNENRSLIITGRFSGQLPESPFIRLAPRVKLLGQDVPLREYDFPITIVQQPVQIIVSASPPNPTVLIGDSLTYSVSWINKSSVPLKDVKIRIFLEGIFDQTTIITNGYVSPIDQSIVWHAGIIPKLAFLQSGDGDEATFHIRLPREFPIQKPDDKDFALKVRAQLETPTIPPETEFVGTHLLVENEFQQKIAGSLSMTPQITYTDPLIPNTGIPLRVGQPTEFTVHWTLATIGEDFENIILKTTLPPWITLTQKFAGDFNPRNLSYDQPSGQLTYSIQRLEANRGGLYQPSELVFQIRALPGINQVGQAIKLMNPVSVSGQGRFSQKTILAQVPEMHSQSIDDRSVPYESFIVREK